MYKETNRTVDEAQQSDALPDLQDYLFEWLDAAYQNPESQKAREVAKLFGELIRRQLFSYDRYVQRLICRCENLALSEVDAGYLGSRSATDELTQHCSPHAEYLRNIPFIKSDVALERQRKTALYGHRARQTDEDKVEAGIRTELSTLLPYFFFSGESFPPHPRLPLLRGYSHRSNGN